MATNSCVESVVPDSMIGATSRSEARASVTAMSFVIDGSPFRRLAAPTMGAPFRRRGGETGNSTAKISSVSEGEQVREMPEWCPERSQRRWPVAVHRRPWVGPLLGVRLFGLAAGELPASEFELERVAVQPEHARRLTDVAADLLQDALNDDPLEAVARLVEVHAQRLRRLAKSGATRG